MYDPRIGRFFARDPLAFKYPFYSPYAFSGNRVVDANELEGLEPVVHNNQIVGYNVKSGQGPTQIAADINNPKTKKEYGYVIVQKIDWKHIVTDNIDYFPENITLDMNDPAYKKLNLNVGNYVTIRGNKGNNRAYSFLLSKEKIWREGLKKMNDEYSKLEHELFGLEKKRDELQDRMAETEKTMELLKEDQPKTDYGRPYSSAEIKYMTGELIWEIGSILVEAYEAGTRALEIESLLPKKMMETEQQEIEIRDMREEIKEIENNQ